MRIQSSRSADLGLEKYFDTLLLKVGLGLQFFQNFQKTLAPAPTAQLVVTSQVTLVTVRPGRIESLLNSVY